MEDQNAGQYSQVNGRSAAGVEGRSSVVVERRREQRRETNEMSMMPDQFDDPALKASLRQRFAGERAPDALRQRILRLVEEGERDVAGRIAPETAGRVAGPAPTAVKVSPKVEPPKSLSLWRRGPTRLAAAIVLLTSGVVIYSMVTRDEGKTSRPQLAARPVSDEVLFAMVKTHDYCCEHTNHRHPAIEQKNFAVMREQTEQRLKHPVVATAVEGWIFKGCYLCPVGGTDSAHLLFTRGDNTLSIFSVAAKDNDSEGAYTAKNVDGHLVAAKVKKRAAIGVVAQPAKPGDPAITLPQVERLLQDHSQAIAAALQASGLRPSLFLAIH